MPVGSFLCLTAYALLQLPSFNEIDELIGEPKPPKRTRKAKGAQIKTNKYVEEDDEDDDDSVDLFHSGTEDDDDGSLDDAAADSDGHPPLDLDMSDGLEEDAEPVMEEPPHRSQQQQNTKRQLGTDVRQVGVSAAMVAKAAKVVSGLMQSRKENRDRQLGGTSSQIQRDVSDMVSQDVPIGRAGQALKRNLAAMRR